MDRLSEVEPDLSTGAWLADFVLLGAGVGGGAPAAVLLVLLRGEWGVACLFGGPGALGGALLGVVVGAGAVTAARLLRDRPLVSFALGFPLGFFAGGAVGAALGSAISPGLGGGAPLIGMMGAVVGGLVLGFTWLPYLALKLQGRSGTALMVAAVLASWALGPLVMGGFLLVEGTAW